MQEGFAVRLLYPHPSPQPSVDAHLGWVISQAAALIIVIIKQNINVIILPENYRTTSPSRLAKTFKITKSNHQYDLPSPGTLYLNVTKFNNRKGERVKQQMDLRKNVFWSIKRSLTFLDCHQDAWSVWRIDGRVQRTVRGRTAPWKALKSTGKKQETVVGLRKWDPFPSF